jgi:hypothetical protein
MLTLIPAYGRDYKSAKKVREDWNAGKDFTIANIFHANDGLYVNIEDLKRDGKETSVGIRFKGLREIVVIKV